MRAEEHQQQQTRAFYHLRYMILNILKPIHDPRLVTGPSSSRRTQTLSQVSPVAFACWFLEMSLALMLFGSIMFVVGFVLMPWVLGLVFLLYLSSFLSSLSGLGRSFFWPTDVPAWNFSPS